ncbi:MAG: hypothetical protein MI922_30740 [Bacteroidales bacterium]|nr:hypothetical protein [Bacteroidales bacterium]
MNKDYEAIIGYYFQKKVNGTSFSEIRKELSNKGYEEQDIKKIIREIDDRVIQNDLTESKRIRVGFDFFDIRYELILGYILMISSGTLFALIRLGYIEHIWVITDLKHSYYTLFGGICGGYFLISHARRRKRKLERNA